MAAADIYTTATQLAILMAGRTPEWSTQDDATPTGPPPNGAAGTALQSAVRTLVHTTLRRNAHHRTAALTISVVDLTDIYTTTINGTAVAYDSSGDADIEDVLNGIADAINADGTANQIVEATAVDTDDDDVLDTVLVEGLAEADFSIDFTQSGTATILCTADAVSARMRLWWMPGARDGSTPPSVWAHDGVEVAVTYRGHLERYDTAGLDRLFVQLDNVQGTGSDGADVALRDAVISVGPCLSEEET